MLRPGAIVEACPGTNPQSSVATHAGGSFPDNAVPGDIASAPRPKKGSVAGRDAGSTLHADQEPTAATPAPAPCAHLYATPDGTCPDCGEVVGLRKAGSW